MNIFLTLVAEHNSLPECFLTETGISAFHSLPGTGISAFHSLPETGISGQVRYHSLPETGISGQVRSVQ